MRRADRLFKIIQILRRRRVTKARQLAEELEVSERTIYRDIKDLMLSGVSIEGEAGVGYALSRHFDMPPLMFTKEEIDALVLGARTVVGYGDPELVKAAQDVLNKVEAVLPSQLKQTLTETPLFAPGFSKNEQTGPVLSLLRTAINKKYKVSFHYTDQKQESTQRTVRPVCLVFAPPHWILTAWCELRESFRNFRLDRMLNVENKREPFENEPGKNLEDFLKTLDM